MKDAAWWRHLFTGDDAIAYDAYTREPAKPGLSDKCKPAVIVVDVVRAFLGYPGLSLADSLREWPSSCGPRAWQALPKIGYLTELATSRGWPVIYTKGQQDAADTYGSTVRSNEWAGDSSVRLDAHDFPPELNIANGALILEKPKASAFFGTALLTYLIRCRIDTVVVAGGTTSGCVRATAVDACSWGFETFIAEDACFDRARLSHGVSLFEMDAKYASVISTEHLVS